MTGTRAYAVREDLKTYNERLLDYARNGGHLIVLYNTQELVPNQFAPFPGELTPRAEEVSEEDSPVTILAPTAPMLNVPQPDHRGRLRRLGGAARVEVLEHLGCRPTRPSSPPSTRGRRRSRVAGCGRRSGTAITRTSRYALPPAAPLRRAGRLPAARQPAGGRKEWPRKEWPVDRRGRTCAKAAAGAIRAGPPAPGIGDAQTRSSLWTARRRSDRRAQAHRVPLARWSSTPSRSTAGSWPRCSRAWASGSDNG